MIIIIIYGISSLYFILFLESLYKTYLQKKNYKRAEKLSKKLNKPLLVIGDPKESPVNFLINSYSYGDICIDMNGCDCKDEKVTILKYKLEDILHTFKDNSVVIFESETLEYVDRDKIDYVIEELYRISNNNIYSVHNLRPNNILTFFKQSGYKWFNYILKKPVFEYRQIFYTYPPYNKYKYKKI